jgi:hypothetical protein
MPDRRLWRDRRTSGQTRILLLVELVGTRQPGHHCHSEESILFDSWLMSGLVVTI